MDDHGTEIQQHPSGPLMPLARQEPPPGFLHGLLHALGDRPDLYIGLRRSDDEVVGHQRVLANVQDDHVLGLPILHRVSSDAG